MSAQPIVVAGLSATPVKGLRIMPSAELVLGRDGAIDNRRFYLIDERGRMVNGKQVGALNEIVADYRAAERHLTLSFPDGAIVADQVALEPAIATSFFSRPARAHPVAGPWSAALSAHASRPLRLVEGDGTRTGVDRGRAGAVSLVSHASMAALAGVAHESNVDPRRFRMLIEVAGPEAHTEDAWVARRLRVGEAVVVMRGHVGRCLVTSRHPETGEVDLPTLELLRSYRENAHTTEPLALGVYGEVLKPGTIRVGDTVELC